MTTEVQPPKAVRTIPIYPLTNAQAIPEAWFRSMASEWGTVSFGETVGFISTPWREMIPEGWRKVAASRGPDKEFALYVDEGTPGGLLYVAYFEPEKNVHLYAAFADPDFDARGVVLDMLATASPLVLEDGSVPVDFWADSPNGPTYRKRSIEAPMWADIAQNYSACARSALATLTAWDAGGMDAGGGRLLLMHGAPGTGKTTAIRALAREWQDWCAVHYVVDPERFFGSASYMLHVLSSDSSMGSPWKLLVVEDAEEFMRQDSKDRVGQSLARLLNVGDGMLGQGLRVLTLLTTNAPVSKLHPAITRPGRCLANIEVGPLSASESSTWIGRHVASPKTLAELYEMRRACESQQVTAVPSLEPSGAFV